MVDDWYDTTDWSGEHTTVHRAAECPSCRGTGMVPREIDPDPPPKTDADKPWWVDHMVVVHVTDEEPPVEDDELRYQRELAEHYNA
jgi:hypothetical protein